MVTWPWTNILLVSSRLRGDLRGELVKLSLVSVKSNGDRTSALNVVARILQQKLRAECLSNASLRKRRWESNTSNCPTLASAANRDVISDLCCVLVDSGDHPAASIHRCTSRHDAHHIYTVMQLTISPPSVNAGRCHRFDTISLYNVLQAYRPVQWTVERYNFATSL